MLVFCIKNLTFVLENTDFWPIFEVIDNYMNREKCFLGKQAKQTKKSYWNTNIEKKT